VVLLDTIPEIITKKIFYRGANITPRDIFDAAAAAGEKHSGRIIRVRSYRDQVRLTLSTMERLHVDFINSGSLN
jgi:hypothetical protein